MPPRELGQDFVPRRKTIRAKAGVACSWLSAIENQRSVPYLLHMFSEGIALFDRHGTVTPVVNEIKQYLASRPESGSEWALIKELHQDVMSPNLRLGGRNPKH